MEEGGACLSQIELSTSQVFLVCVFQFEKLIPFLLLPMEAYRRRQPDDGVKRHMTRVAVQVMRGQRDDANGLLY